MFDIALKNVIFIYQSQPVDPTSPLTSFPTKIYLYDE